MRTSTNFSRHSKCVIKLAVTASLVGASAAMANTQTSTWAGPANSNWNNAAHWSPNGVPNNGTGGFTDYNVIIGASSPALMDLDGATIDLLTVNPGSQLTINSSLTLNVKGPTVTNNGLIQIDTLGSNADLNFTANTLLTGTGIIKLNDYNPSARLSAAAGVTVTQDIGHTISGVGDLTAAFINNGTVNANFSGRALSLTTNNMTNNALFEATGGGTLAIGAITVTQGSGAQILAGSTGAVSLNGSTINGGALNAVVGSSIYINNSTLNSVTIGAGTSVVLPSASVVNVSGGSLVNNGLIQVDTYSSDAALNFTANTALTGSGSIYLNDYNPSARLIGNAGVVVTQAASHTIYGLGDIGVSLVNNGVVNANDTRGTRALMLRTSPMTNNNLFEATGGGILDINGIAVTQSANGKITADGTSSVSIHANASVIGGTLTAAAGGVINVSDATFNNVKISAGTNVLVLPATTLNIVGGSLVNDGLIQVDYRQSSGAINFTTNAQLTGTGSIYVNDWNPDAKLSAPAGVTVTQAATHTIYGIGAIDAAFVNNGTVNANQNVGTRALTLKTGPMTNNNLFEATAGGILAISGIAITQNAAGQIVADASSFVTLGSGATVTGGKLVGPGGYSVLATIGTNTLHSVTIAAGTPLTVPAGANLTLNGVANNGTLTVGGTVSLTGLTGTGTLALNDNGPGIVTLPLGSGQSSQGALSIAYGKLDITDNKFALNYGVGNPSPVATIRGYLRTGYNNGSWTGTGIVSSKTAATPGHAILYADGTNTAAPGQVLFRDGLAGDFNLDNSVNFSDLVALAQNYGVSNNAIWTQGDVNYNGAVGFDDLVALAQNYNRTLSVAEVSEVGPEFAADFALAQSLVPEPTLLCLPSIAVALVARRRSR